MTNELPPAFLQARQKNQETRRSLWFTAVICLIAICIVGGAVGGATGFLDARSEKDLGASLSAWFIVIGAMVAGLLSLIWSVNYWRTIDEMAKRAHLDSFFWGGTIAWSIVFPLGVVAVAFPNWEIALIENAATTSTHAFGIGVCAAIAVTLLGYLIFWLFWWAKKR